MKLPHHQHFHCYIVFVVVLHAFRFRCYKKVTFLVSATLSSAELMDDGAKALIRGNMKPEVQIRTH